MSTSLGKCVTLATMKTDMRYVMNEVAKLNGRLIAQLQTMARARHVGVAETKVVRRYQAVTIVGKPKEARVECVQYNPRKHIVKIDAFKLGTTWTVVAIGKRVTPKRAVTSAPVADARAKRREALMKMRALWSDSAAAAGRTEGEDGVAYQRKLRAEW